MLPMLFWSQYHKNVNFYKPCCYLQCFCNCKIKTNFQDETWFMILKNTKLKLKEVVAGGVLKDFAKFTGKGLWQFLFS